MLKHTKLKRICLVEDEESLVEMIALNLELEGYMLTHFANGSDAFADVENGSNYDLYILDVMLPGIDGVTLCKNIRKSSNVPVLFLSAKGTTVDRIEGLKAGGNDYLPKPFDLEELILRVQVLTQGVQEELSELMIGDNTVNLKTYEVTNTKGETIGLSKKEVAMLKLFYEREGEVVSRTEILDKIWGKDQFPTTRTIDNFILNLRKKFEENPRDPRYFHSVRGVGYKFTK
jgi:two-component system alkaline phosphatase synthesis response regulator PhoP